MRREIGDEDGEALVLSNMADTQIVLGDFARASESMQRAISIHTELGDDRNLAWDHRVMGLHAFSRGKLDSALVYLSQSLAGHEAIDEKPAIAEAKGLLGEVYLAKDDFKQALSEKQYFSVVVAEVEFHWSFQILEEDRAERSDHVSRVDHHINISLVEQLYGFQDRRLVVVGVGDYSCFHLLTSCNHSIIVLF